MHKSSNDGAALSIAVRDKYINALTSYTKAELMELKDRQSKLLANKLWMDKLADKGARIQSLYDRLLVEIELRNEMNQAAAIFSDLNIAEKGLKIVTQMEWNGGKVYAHEEFATVDSDDDDDATDDPLKLIAQSRSHTKIIKIEKPAASLVTAADLEEIKSFSVDQLDPHALYMCEKDRNFDEIAIGQKKKFFAHKTTKSDVHSIANEKSRVNGKNWEVTAATPPILRNNEAKLLTLKESIEIERKHKDELKQLQQTQASERLKIRQKIISENISLLPDGIDLTDPNKLFQSYREKGLTDDESDNDSFSENSDNGEEPYVGGVTISAYD